MKERIKFPCPCGGKIGWKKEKVIQEGIDCGILDVEICNKCGTKYLPDESMIIVENKLKEKGLWGVKRKEIKFWKTGSSVTIRVPAEFTKALRLDKVDRGYIYKEGENKFAVEY